MREASILQRGPGEALPRRGVGAETWKNGRERAQGSQRSEHARGQHCCAQGRGKPGCGVGRSWGAAGEEVRDKVGEAGVWDGGRGWRSVFPLSETGAEE